MINTEHIANLGVREEDTFLWDSSCGSTVLKSPLYRQPSISVGVEPPTTC